MKQVTCKSGIKGWQAKLQKVYENFEEFTAYDEMYNISNRLGFSSPKIAWERNPIIKGSVNPNDLQKV